MPAALGSSAGCNLLKIVWGNAITVIRGRSDHCLHLNSYSCVLQFHITQKALNMSVSSYCAAGYGFTFICSDCMIYVGVEDSQALSGFSNLISDMQRWDKHKIFVIYSFSLKHVSCNWQLYFSKPVCWKNIILSGSVRISIQYYIFLLVVTVLWDQNVR